MATLQSVNSEFEQLMSSQSTEFDNSLKKQLLSLLQKYQKLESWSNDANVDINTVSNMSEDTLEKLLNQIENESKSSINEATSNGNLNSLPKTTMTFINKPV